MFMVYCKRPGQKRFSPIANASRAPYQTDRLVYASRWKNREGAKSYAEGMTAANPGCTFEARPIRVKKRVSA